MNKIKIAHIDSGKSWRGGQAQVFLLLKGLKNLDTESILFSPPDSPLTQKTSELDIKVFPIPLRNEWGIISALKIKKIIEKENIDLIHVHDAKSQSIAWLTSFFLKNIPIISTRRVDFGVGKHFFSRKKYINDKVYYIAISNGVKEVLIKSGVNPSQITLVHSGIDIQKFDSVRDKVFQDSLRDKKKNRNIFPSDWGIRENDIIIGNIASLAEHKGQRYLIEAAEKIVKSRDDIKFIIVGEGEERRNLEILIDQYNLKNKFYLAGFQKNIGDWLSTFDIFVLSSHLEGLCTSILDAMLLEVPVIGTNTGGVPDIIENDKTGLLVPPRDSDSLYKSILKLISDNELRKRLISFSLNMVKENFSDKKMVEGTYSVYMKILKERNKERK